MNNFEPYSVLLSISTDIPVLRMTALCSRDTCKQAINKACAATQSDSVSIQNPFISSVAPQYHNGKCIVISVLSA